MHSLNQKLLIALFLTGLISLVIGGLVTDLSLSTYLNSQFKEETNTLTKLATVATQEPVFTYDFSQNKQLANAFKDYPNISQIKIFDHRNKILAEAKKDAVGDTFTTRQELLRGKDIIGFVDLTFDKGFLEQQRIHLMLVIGGIILAVLLLISITLFFTIRRLVIIPINHVAVSLREISSGKGDLTCRLPENRRDEIGQLAHAFNETMSTLASLIREMNCIGHTVQNTAAQLAKTANNTQENTDRQLMEVDQIATALQEMSASATEVAASAEKTAETSQEASTEASRGQQSVAGNAKAIHLLTEEIDNTSEQIITLHNNSKNISSIVTVIRNIAEQTNLLALNAAIEAARAGEQGRGFAVVADEVRNLAHKTQTSTHEIEQIVDELQKSAETANLSMNDNKQIAISANDATQAIQSVLLSLNERIQTINDMNSHVAAASYEQSTVTTEISQHVTSMQDISHTVSKLNQDVAIMANEVSDQSNTLIAKLEQFRT
jgi:methyl-accepting chemotaxis protein